jgi:hypothetical protein
LPLVGCAFGARRVDLTYGAALPPQSLAPARFGRVGVARFLDARPDAQSRDNVLAKVRNGYGMPTASVLANQNPVLWVNEGVARTLVKQGFVVERIQSPADAPDLPTVTGRVTGVSGGMYMSVDAQVSAELAIEQRGSNVGSMACAGSASKIAWTASANEFQATFEAAMISFADTCGPKLTEVLTGGRAP